MSDYGLTYRSTTCYLNITDLKFVTILKIAFSLEFVSLCKKNNSLLLLILKGCKLSYFINIDASTLDVAITGWQVIQVRCKGNLGPLLLHKEGLFTLVTGTYHDHRFLNSPFGWDMSGEPTSIYTRSPTIRVTMPIK